MEKDDGNQKTFEETLLQTMNQLVDSLDKTITESEPILHFRYPDPPRPLTAKELRDWAEQLGGYFLTHASTYEKSLRGMSCCVDRARSIWMEPECEKMLDYLNTVAIVSDKDN